MKKALLMAALTASVMVFLGCATTGGGDGTSGNTTSGNAPIVTQEQANQALQEVYQEYKSGLILDGAATYTVKSGDTLNDISRARYNNGYYYPVIMLASSNVVLDHDKIEPGMQLTIPDLQKNLNDSNARANIKKYLPEIAEIEERRAESGARARADIRRATARGLRDLANSL